MSFASLHGGLSSDVWLDTQTLLLVPVMHLTTTWRRISASHLLTFMIGSVRFSMPNSTLYLLQAHRYFILPRLSLATPPVLSLPLEVSQRQDGSGGLLGSA